MIVMRRVRALSAQLRLQARQDGHRQTKASSSSRRGGLGAFAAISNAIRRINKLLRSAVRKRMAYDVAYWRIVLKNSKIARLRKSRNCSALAFSAIARHCRIDTSTSDRFNGNLCGPPPRHETDQPGWSDDVRCSTSTGSGWQKVKTALLTQSGRDSSVYRATCAAHK